MIALGLRLLFRSGREALWRLSAIVGGVTLGTAMLLIILAGFTALDNRDARSAWLETEGTTIGNDGELPQDVLLWNKSLDMFDAKTIDRVDVAGNGSDTHVPGVEHLPGPGEYYASPALTELINTHPNDQLADRYGKQVGVLDIEVIGAANDLIVLVGRQPDKLADSSGTMAVTEINKQPGGTDIRFLQIALAVGAVGIIFPTAMFVAVSTRLAAARREERFAAIRLVGGTKRQIIALATVETSVGALSGLLLGYLLFMPLSYVVTKFEFVGVQFYHQDLKVTLSQLLAVWAGVFVVTVGMAYVALRKVDISPLGVTRKAPAKPPRAWRVIPLLLGMAGVIYMAYKDNGAANELTMIVTFLLCGLGVFLIGPWLAWQIARLLKRIDLGSATLIAGSRLLAQPSAIFRAVSGIVIAIFVVSVFSSIMTTYTKGAPSNRQPVIAESTLAVDLLDTETQQDTLRQYQTVRDAANGTPDATSIITLYGVPEGLPDHTVTLKTEGQSHSLEAEYLLSCQDAQALGFNECPDGKFIALPSYALFDRQYPPEGWQYVEADTSTLQPSRLLVGTTGGEGAVERVRTAVAQATGDSVWILTDEELFAKGVRLFTQIKALTNLGILVVLLVAGCSLLVAVADSLLERKRPFTLLRLTGMSLGQLRAAVMLEAAVPLVATALLAAVAGTLFGGLLLKATNDSPLMAPSLDFVLTLAAGVGLSLAIVACTLPLLGKMTRSENARFE